jgi:hypothetical protein
MSSFVVLSGQNKFPFGPIYFIATLENVATSFQVDFMTFGACLLLQTGLQSAGLQEQNGINPVLIEYSYFEKQL